MQRVTGPCGELRAASPGELPWRSRRELLLCVRQGLKEEKGSKTELLEGGLISQADILFFPSFAIFQCEMVMRGVRAEL